MLPLVVEVNSFSGGAALSCDEVSNSAAAHQVRRVHQWQQLSNTELKYEALGIYCAMGRRHSSPGQASGAGCRKSGAQSNGVHVTSLAFTFFLSLLFTFFLSHLFSRSPSLPPSRSPSLPLSLPSRRQAGLRQRGFRGPGAEADHGLICAEYGDLSPPKKKRMKYL